MSRETWRETLCYGTPLHWALMGGHEAAVHRSRGRRQPPPKRDGRTALHCAAATSIAGKLVRMLLDAGADPHALDHAGDRPNDLARRAKRPTVARVLHEAGVGLIAKAPSKDTAFVRTYPVRMNLTLSLDAKVVAEARRSAAAMGLSLNQAVRNYLVRLAGLRSPEEEIAEVKRLSEMAGGDRAGWTFDRDEIHRRA